MEGKKKNIFIAILGVTTVAAAGAALYLGLKYNSLKIEASKKDEVISESNENDTTPKEIEKIVTEYSIPEVTSENRLNKIDENVEYSNLIRGEYSAYGLSYFVPNDEKTISLGVSDSILNSETVRGKEVSFDSKIKNVYIGFVGNASLAGSDVMFCVLEDGSVHCMNLYDAILNNEYNFTKLDGVSNVIEVNSASFAYKNGIGYTTIVAFNKEGKFYDLQDILRDKGLIK